jgi:hypothetical protein
METDSVAKTSSSMSVLGWLLADNRNAPSFPAFDSLGQLRSIDLTPVASGNLVVC